VRPRRWTHLIAAGHRRIAHLAGTRRDGSERRAAFVAAIAAAAGLEPGRSSTATSPRRAGRRRPSGCLADPDVTAVFCASDRMAVGLLHAAHQRGIAVPDDLSVVGFDDLTWARYLCPPLTTVRQPGREMGRAAARLVLDGPVDADAEATPARDARRSSCAPRPPPPAPRAVARPSGEPSGPEEVIATGHPGPPMTPWATPPPNEGACMRRTLSLIVALLVLTVASAQSLTFWTTEEQPERMATQERIAADFEAATGISVAVVPVTESQLGERMTAAFAAGDLPDVVFHPVNYTLGWAEAGILDTAAATEVIDDLGARHLRRRRARPDVASTASTPPSRPTAGPSCCSTAPTCSRSGPGAAHHYEAILAAVERCTTRPNMYGFVAATDPSQDYMMQVFEHFALANGVQLVDDDGNVTLDTPAMVETLEFYKALAEPARRATSTGCSRASSTRTASAAMIVWSPFILTSWSACATQFPCRPTRRTTAGWLAEQHRLRDQHRRPEQPGRAPAGRRSTSASPSTPTSTPPRRSSSTSLTDGYLDWLSMAAEGKFPVRSGTPSSRTSSSEGGRPRDRRRPLRAAR
jgi:multiple sugar transport system substrate-binding protein